MAQKNKGGRASPDLVTQNGFSKQVVSRLRPQRRVFSRRMGPGGRQWFPGREEPTRFKGPEKG